MTSKKTEKLDHFPDVRKMVYACKMFKINLLRRCKKVNVGQKQRKIGPFSKRLKMCC